MRPWSGVNLADASGEDGCKIVHLGDTAYQYVNYGEGRTDNYFRPVTNPNDYPSVKGIIDVFCNKDYAPYTHRTNGSELPRNTGLYICLANQGLCVKNLSKTGADLSGGIASWLNGIIAWYPLATPVSFTSLFLSASSTADELTQMPADAIPLSEIQFADNNWSIEEAIYDAPEADANGVITPTAVTGQMRIQYSLDAAEQIDTLQKEYLALEARVTALENA